MILDKLFNNNKKKKQDDDIFYIPNRKHSHDIKNVNKLSQKTLQQIVLEQEKYINILVKKINDIQAEFCKYQQKIDELEQKNQVINNQISKMVNQHEESTMKFDNLQTALEIMIASNQQLYKEQVNFLSKNQQNQTALEIPNTIQKIITFYQDKFILCNKIHQQNKFLKSKISDIQLKLEQIKEKYQQGENEKRYNSLLPELMQSLEELKRQRKNSNYFQNQKIYQEKQKNQQTIILKQMQTNTGNQLYNFIELVEHEKILDRIEKEYNLQVNNLESESNRILHQLNQSQKNIQNLKQKNSIFSSQLYEESQKHKVKAKECKMNLQRINELENKIINLQRQKSKIEEQLKVFHIKLEEINNKNRLLVQNQRDSLMKQIKEKETEQVQSDNLNKNQVEQKDSIMEDKKLIQGLNEQNRKLRKLIGSFQSQLQILKTELKNSSIQINSKKIQIDNISEETEDLKHQLSSSNKLIEKMQENYQKHIKQTEEEMMSKIYSLESCLNQKENQLLCLRNEKTNLSRQNSKINAERQNLSAELMSIKAYKNQTENKILPTLRTELQNLKKQSKRMIQQKQTLQQSQLSSIDQLNTAFQLLSKQKSLLDQKYSKLLKELASKQNQIQTYETTLNKLNQEMTERFIKIQQLTTIILKMQESIKQKGVQLETVYEQLRSKQRRYESELNQQRIKNDTMKRILNHQETKIEQNQKSLNKFYEDSLHKDKKITYMQVKLKEYKTIIQSLKKQKDELEKCYENKLKNYEEVIVEVPNQESFSEKDVRESKQKEKNQTTEGSKEQIQNNRDYEYLRNQIMSNQQSNLILNEENNKLREDIRTLEEQLIDRKRQIELLQDKREQTLKQIQKLNLRTFNQSRSPYQGNQTLFLIERQKELVHQRELYLSQKQKLESRVKKIATKAYKGFDILLKKHQGLYKDFMQVFVKQLVREQVKSIESQLNVLINKSTDMKDIFNDYL